MFAAGNSLSASQLLPPCHAAPATAGFPCLRCIMEISKCGLDKSETFFLLVWGKKEQGTFFRFPARCAAGRAVSIKF